MLRVIQTNCCHKMKRANISNKIWKLDLNYNFPIKTSVVGKKQKIVKFKWFFNFPCLAYSKSENGAICKYCVAFAKNEAGVIIKNWDLFCLKKYDDAFLRRF